MRLLLSVFATMTFALSAFATDFHPTAIEAQAILGDNFYEVQAGQLYRSAQMSTVSFEKYIQKYGIKTVINLRGASPGEPWYEQEADLMKQLNVLHINIPMSAKRLPHRQDLLTLLDAFQNAPRPILIHCKEGADRTGEASALWQMLYMGKSKEQAMSMLSPKYGHFASLMPAKDYFIQTVWQGLDWAYQSYNPCSGQYKYYDTNAAECKPAN